MNQIVTIGESINTLPAMVAAASKRLAEASNAAEILEAKDSAGFAYDMAKKTARLAKAKGAHDELISKAHRAQADALEIEAAAKRRLADEYDAAQERGEVGQQTGRPKVVTNENDFIPSAADIGLSRKDIHEARQLRDAELAHPGITRQTLDERLAAGAEPTKAAVRAAITSAIANGFPSSTSNKNPNYRPAPLRQANNQLVALFRELNDVIGACDLDGIINAFVDDGERQRGISAAYQAKDRIEQFLEAANA